MALRAIPLATLVLAAGLTAGCTETTGMSQNTLATGGGAVVGGVLGALAGRQIGGGTTGAIVGGLVGAGAGAMLGNAIAQRLSERERQVAQASTTRVLDAPPRPGVRDAWVSPETPGNRGSNQLVRVNANDTCRTVREVAYVRGEEIVQESNYCRASNGGWARQT